MASSNIEVNALNKLIMGMQPDTDDEIARKNHKAATHNFKGVIT